MRAFQQGFLDVDQQVGNGGGQTGLRDERLAFAAGLVAAGQGNGSFFDILGADLDAQGHAAHFPVVELEAGRDLGAVVHFDTDAGGL